MGNVRRHYFDEKVTKSSTQFQRNVCDRADPTFRAAFRLEPFAMSSETSLLHLQQSYRCDRDDKLIRISLRVHGAV